MTRGIFSGGSREISPIERDLQSSHIFRIGDSRIGAINPREAVMIFQSVHILYASLETPEKLPAYIGSMRIDRYSE